MGKSNKFACETCGMECGSSQRLRKHYNDNPGCVTSGVLRRRKCSARYRARQRATKCVQSEKKPQRQSIRNPQPATRKMECKFCPNCGLSLEKLASISDLL